MRLYKPVKTPCVGICSTGIGDQVCRGCKRFSHEVIDWNAYSHEQRTIIAQRLESFLTQVVKIRIEIVNEKILFEQIKHQQIQFKPEQNAHCWVFDLLRAGAGQIKDLDVYGLRLLPAWRDTPLQEIRELIDQDFYALSCAYHDRYINPHFNLEQAPG
ncbi:MAG TPA: DUF1289 domain-containing protein [Cellvibrio sp.]|nr:DUF1289 domain-containing protein [Cellvibrio sp.]